MYGAFEPKASPEEFVVVPNVKAISNGIVLICALPDGRRFGVPSVYIGEQSEVRHPGDHGALAVVRWFAEDHCLLSAP
jgi:hypothetical protein